MALHVVNEARRCLNCKVPQCRKGCPINTPIPDMIQLFLQNQLEAAGEMLFLNNPLSIVCSLVCDHEKQCEGTVCWDEKECRYIYPALKITFPTLIWIACPPFCRLLPESGLLSSEAVLPESPSLCFWLKKDMM